MITADHDIRNGITGILHNKKNAEYLVIDGVKAIIKASINEGHFDVLIEDLVDEAVSRLENKFRDRIEASTSNICNEYMSYYFDSDHFKETVLKPIVIQCIKPQ